MIDLKQFCNDNGNYFGQPLRVGEFVYATDGYIAVRVAAADYPDAEEAKVGSRFSDNILSLFWPVESECTIPWPEGVPVMGEIKCPDCEGIGRVGTTVCANCGGDGETECFECGQDVDCDRCHGTGMMGGTTCAACDGNRRREGVLRFEILGTNLADKYVQLIASLPGVKAKPVTNPIQPVRFRFDGGVGLVMPVTL